MVDLIRPDGRFDLFGSGGLPGTYEYDYRDTSQITTSQEPILYKKFTTKPLPAGNYEITWNYSWHSDNNTQNFEAGVYLDGALLLESIHKQEPKEKSNIQYVPITGFMRTSLSAGSHTIELKFNSTKVGAGAQMHNSQFRIWRIS